MREAMIWGLSAGLPASAIVSLQRQARAPADRPHGWHHLALPARLGMAADPLRNWDALDPRVSCDPEPPLAEDAPAVVDPPAAAGPLPLQLRGMVAEGDSILYWLFDTRARRWLRLRPGESDPESHYRLEQADEPGRIVLTDLLSGQSEVLSTDSATPVDAPPVADPTAGG